MGSLGEREVMALESSLSKLNKDLEKEWKDTRSYMKTGIVSEASYEDLRKYEDRLNYHMDHIYFVYRYKGEVIGFIQTSHMKNEKYEGLRWSSNQLFEWIEDLYIDESQRKQGYGYELMKHVHNLGTAYRIVVQEENIPMLKLVNLFEYRFVGEYLEGKSSYYCFEKNPVQK
jgi:GNAT superfamily N-acetyltransferase